MSGIKLSKRNDIAGRRSGRLVAESPAFRGKNGKLFWNCRCDCGNTHLVWQSDILTENTKSCGCLVAEQIKGLNYKHGESRQALYGIWNQMKRRCLDERCKAYPDYGGRGIKVAPEWLGDGGYERFRDHIGPRPSPAYTVDRYPDMNGDYAPGNVRWATRAQQARNRRVCRKYTYLGETKTIAEWARDFGLGVGQLWGRLVRMKMPFHEAVAMPHQSPRRKVEYQGKRVSLKQLAMLTGVSYEVLLYRIVTKGEPVEHAVREVQTKQPTVTLTYNGRTLTIKEWAAITGLKHLTIWQRVAKKGWSAEQALTTPSRKSPEAFRHPDAAERRSD